MDLTGFDASQVEPLSDFEPIPKGEYLAMAIDSEAKDTKSGRGKYLQIAWEVLEGQHRGCRLWSRLNLKNENPMAVKIAEAELSAICRAVGVNKPQDSAELHDKPLLLKVDVEERNDKPGVYRNEVKGYAPASGQAAPAHAQATAPVSSAPQAQQAQSLPPWKRKAS